MASLKEIFRSDKQIQSVVKWASTNDGKQGFCVRLTCWSAPFPRIVLRGVAMPEYIDREIKLHLEIDDGRHGGRHMARAEWRPFHRHGNQGIGPRVLQGEVFSGTHVHLFRPNYIADEDRMRSRLTIAVPLQPDLTSCQEFIDRIGKYFRISNMENVPPPPAQANMRVFTG